MALIESSGSYKGAEPWSVLEESFVWDLEEYFGGRLQRRVDEAVSTGDINNRDVHAFLWLNEHVPLKRGPNENLLAQRARSVLPLEGDVGQSLDEIFGAMQTMSPEQQSGKGIGAGEMTPSLQATQAQVNDWEWENLTLAQKMQRRR